MGTIIAIAKILSAIAIIGSFIISISIFYYSVKRKTVEVSNAEEHQGLWWETFYLTCVKYKGQVSRPKGYQRFRWHFYCWNTAFWDTLLKRKD